MTKASLLTLALTLLLVTVVLGQHNLHTQYRQLQDVTEDPNFEDELRSAADQMLSGSNNSRKLACIEKSNKKKNCTARGGSCKAACPEQKSKRLCQGGCSCCLPCKDTKRCMKNGGKCMAKNMTCAGEKADKYCKGGCTCCLPIATDIVCNNKGGFCAANTGNYCRGEVSLLQNSCNDLCSCCLSDVCAADQFLLGTECFKAFLSEGHKVDWNTARDICLSDGGDLAEPQDAEALRDYVYKVYGEIDLWLGGKFQEAIASFLSGDEITDYYSDDPVEGECLYLYVDFYEYTEEKFFSDCGNTMLPLCEYNATRLITRTPSTVCGGEYNSNNGTLRHPLSGGNYKNNEYCTWIIRAEGPIKIIFDQFDTEAYIDELTIRDGEIIDSVVLDEKSGTNDYNAKMFHTKTNASHLLFKSDFSNTYSGFELHWEPFAPYCLFEMVYADQDTVCPIEISLTWQDAFDYCRNYGLNLAQPKDLLSLSVKLVEAQGWSNWFWIGGKGSGNQQLWLNGTAIDPSLSEWFPDEPNNATTDCLVFQTSSSGTEVLETKTCLNNTGFFLCTTD